MKLPKYELVLQFGFWTAIIGFFGFMILTIIHSSNSILNTAFLGFKAMFLAGLFITSYAFVQRGLERFGAKDFGFSAFISIIGFILIYIPILLLFLNLENRFMTTLVKTGIVLVGLLLIIYGLFTEQFELNRKIAEQFVNLRQSFKDILTKLNWKRLYHPSNILLLGALSLIILKYARVSPVSAFQWSVLAFIAGGLLVLNLVLQFPKELYRAITSLGELLHQVSVFFIQGIKNLPKNTVASVKWLYRSFIKSIVFVFHNDYILLPVLGGLGFFTLPFSLDVKLGIFFLSLLIAIFRLSIVNPSFIKESLSITRSQTFKFTTRVRSFNTRFQKRRCVYCDSPLSGNSQVCPYCHGEQPRDIVSNAFLTRDTIVRQCPHCHHYGSVKYIDTWLSQRRVCPYCKQPFRPYDSRAMKLGQFIKPVQKAKESRKGIFDSFAERVKTIIINEPPQSQNQGPDNSPSSNEKTQSVSWNFSKTSYVSKENKVSDESHKKNVKEIISKEGKKTIQKLGKKALTGELNKEEASKEIKQFVDRVKEELIDEKDKTKKTK